MAVVGSALGPGGVQGEGGARELEVELEQGSGPDPPRLPGTGPDVDQVVPGFVGGGGGRLGQTFSPLWAS